MVEGMDKLKDDVRRFLEVYKVLLPEGKALFESKILASLKDMDERTKKLYAILLKASRCGLGVEETIQEMQKFQG